MRYYNHNAIFYFHLIIIYDIYIIQISFFCITNHVYRFLGYNGYHCLSKAVVYYMLYIFNLLIVTYHKLPFSLFIKKYFLLKSSNYKNSSIHVTRIMTETIVTLSRINRSIVKINISSSSNICYIEKEKKGYI